MAKKIQKTVNENDSKRNIKHVFEWLSKYPEETSFCFGNHFIVQTHKDHYYSEAENS